MILEKNCSFYLNYEKYMFTRYTLKEETFAFSRIFGKIAKV